MKDQAPPIEVTADVAMVLLGVTTRQAISKLAREGHLPGSHKLKPEKRSSPLLIPMAAIDALKKKRAAAAKA